MDRFTLLELIKELQRLHDLLEALPTHAEASALLALLCHTQKAVFEAERLIALSENSSEPMPWWQDWQRKYGAKSTG